MLDRLSEMMAMFLVALGQAISRLSPQQKQMVTLLLTFLMVACAMARALQLAVSLR